MSTFRDATVTLSRVKCLLVDDLEENLLALSALLRADDVELLTARSGPAALDLLLEHDVALAVLDVQMPEMDGFELAELMRGSSRTRHVPLIFVTAGANDQRRVFKGYDSGAVDFLYKPIDPHILRSKADVFFQLYRQRRRLADDLRERTETLRLNEMFSAVLSHDLRNPLNAILTASRLLETRADDDLIRQASARITSSARRMARLIDDMLDLARGRLAGGIPLRPQDANLGVLMDGVMLEHCAMAPSRDVEVQRCGDLSGIWDSERLAQALSNLIGNALQHGSPDAPVRVEIDGSGTDRVVVTVANGGTIPADVAPHVFDPFRSAAREEMSSARPGRRDGLGLGLYIVQQIIQAHGGSIDLDSSAPGWTVFRAEIPRVVPGCNRSVPA